MTSKLSISCEFKLTSKEELVLTYSIANSGQMLSLQLQDLMQFLFQNEDNLEASDSEFLFFVSKVTKKLSFDNQFVLGITYDEDMCHFFRHILEKNIPCEYKSEDGLTALDTSSPLPIHMTVSQSGLNLVCQIQNAEELLRDPRSCLFLQADGHYFCFSDGSIQPLSKDLFNFIYDCIDENPKKIADSNEQIQFIKTIYTPHKGKIDWTIRADFSTLIPEEITPTPYLTLRMKGSEMSIDMAFQYDGEIIRPDSTDMEIINRNTGKRMTRMPDMESIFQQDLMAVFQEHNIPFLLNNPGDIAKFLDLIVPQLTERDWMVNSEVENFKVHSTPIDLEFAISSSNKDWFHFEPNCSILDQNISLQEIASMMLENQGYVQTKKGFVKISSDSQEQLNSLAKLEAFKVGKSFSKRDILPLMTACNAKGTTKDSQEIIEGIKGYSAQDCKITDDFNGELRNYQHHGVHWMSFLSKIGQGGILADDMGLGKTIQTLAFTASLEEDGPTLVICPTSLIYNWQSEIEKFLPGKTSIAYTGSNRHKSLENFQNTDYIICSYGIIKNDIDYISSIHYKAIIVDEAQYIKNPNAQVSQAVKELQGGFKLAMTGTPIENSLQDIWNLFDFVMPDYLGSKTHFDWDIRNDDLAGLRARVKPFILRREKREVLDSLPEKTEIIQKCPLSNEQMTLYKSVLEQTKQSLKSKNQVHILTALLKLRQVCTHPTIIPELKDTNMPSAKFELITEKCDELIAEGHKVVLFSQFTSMLDVLQRWTEGHDYYFERIDGSVSSKKRIEAVNRFQTTDKPGLFLISLKAGGVGLNLTAADYVIHVDPWWNPAIEAQATDRVHRMGQKNKVIVYKFICQGTIEETIQELQDEKRTLLQEIVEVDGIEERQINISDIKNLILST